MMSNMIDYINHPGSENTEAFLLGNDETSGCSLVETLEKNKALLCLEARQVEKINSELEAKLRQFNELSSSITSKLQSLVTLSELCFGNKGEIKEFINKITMSWLQANKQVVKEYAAIRVASRTMAGTPLTTVLEQKKKEAAAIKVSLQIGSVIYDQDYVSRGYKIYGEILGILESLKTCDDKIQHYLVISKTTPYLIQLSTTIDEFVANTDLLPPPKKIDVNPSEDLGAFAILSKLLTGELLCLEPTNPQEILSNNAPRKPVFITFNNKRKIIDIPKISGSKIIRSSSFPSALKNT